MISYIEYLKPYLAKSATMSRVIASLLVTLLALRAPVTQAHGDHGHGIAFDDNAIDDRSYMQKHVSEVGATIAGENCSGD